MKEYRFKFIMENKDKDINGYRVALQDEHANLLVRFRKLNERVTSSKEQSEELTLKRMQLKAMDDYIQILQARMALVDVYFSDEDNSYFVKSAEITEF